MKSMNSLVRLVRKGSGVAVVGALVAAASLSACSNDGGEPAAIGTEITPTDAPTTAPATEAPVATEAPATTVKSAPAPMAEPKPGECPAADGSSAQKRTFATEQPKCIDVAKKYKVTMETTKGTMTFELDPSKAPRTVNNFVTLAQYKYFDGISFHRVVRGFVIQGGDPQGTGGGGPGYTFADELPAAGEYKIGSLAMANAGPNTNGSQFFIITGANGAALPPNYSLFGKLTSGEDVMKAIDLLGPEGQDGPPSEPVSMTKVTAEAIG